MAAYTAVDDPGSFFNTILYTGTGSSLAVTGAGFQPDFTWIKNRDTTDIFILTDAVRGATKYISSDSGAIEVTNVESLKSFDSDGFTVGTMNEVNTSTEDYVSWNWKMGTTTGIAGSPSITPTAYSFNQTAGQSIITYTGDGNAGATIPHGLGVAPDVVFCKRLTTSVNTWIGYVSAAPYGNTYGTFLDTNAVFSTDTQFWNDTSPTSTLVTLGTYAACNLVSNDYVAYCFADVQGYSKSGTYIGNATTDFGSFVYTGFRPAYILIKTSSSTGAWYLFDNKREGYNFSNNSLTADTAAVEDTTDYLNIVSTGFALNTTSAVVNGAGTTYFYMAFADSPIVNSNGVPANSR